MNIVAECRAPWHGLNTMRNCLRDAIKDSMNKAKERST